MSKEGCDLTKVAGGDETVSPRAGSSLSEADGRPVELRRRDIGAVLALLNREH
jgi:hypothetical protein